MNIFFLEFGNVMQLTEYSNTVPGPNRTFVALVCVTHTNIHTLKNAQLSAEHTQAKYTIEYDPTADRNTNNRM